MRASTYAEATPSYLEVDQSTLGLVPAAHTEQSATLPNAGKLPAKRRVRFGPFLLRVETRELSKSGSLVKLQGKPAQVLEALISRRDELVRREELCAVLWPEGSFVDFDAGLNTAVNRLRTVLGDNAEAPRYIQTIPRLGYRFICPVQAITAELPEVEGRDSLPRSGENASACADLAATLFATSMLWRLALATVLVLVCNFLLFKFT
ncbi:MAG: winged helix-turn-helix domain-containing protein [Acidobacteriaceae bacterium]|nr:winged helix-turn-helix domain-containing protein [Acidobacteriaceae bacterium]